MRTRWWATPSRPGLYIERVGWLCYATHAAGPDAANTTSHERFIILFFRPRIRLETATLLSGLIHALPRS
jgi:hypothetical protein